MSASSRVGEERLARTCQTRTLAANGRDERRGGSGEEADDGHRRTAADQPGHARDDERGRHDPDDRTARQILPRRLQQVVERMLRNARSPSPTTTPESTTSICRRR